MLSVFQKKYTSFVVLIWSVVGVLVGMVLGVGMGWKGKMLGFLVVLGLGIVWIIFLEHMVQSKTKVETTIPIAPVLPKEINLTLPTRKEDVRIMSPEESRLWLDAFLVKQQEK